MNDGKINDNFITIWMGNDFISWCTW